MEGGKREKRKKQSMEGGKREKRKKQGKRKKEIPEEVEEVEEKGISTGSLNAEPNAKEHVKQLQRLQEKDPEFYEFLKEHDKELLDFDDEDNDEEEEDDTELQETTDADMEDQETLPEKTQTPQKTITTAMVDSWCKEIRENSKLSAVRSLLRAFRTACHYGDEHEDESSVKFSTMSSSVFNKVMLVSLSEMDGILRGLLKMPSAGGKKETIVNLMSTKHWKNYNHLLKSYLGNSLHVLNQMTDTEMISFTLRRLRFSAVFLAAFPSLLRKYIKVALHFWGTGGGALPVVSFLFLRDLCIRLGSDCVDECFKGIYKAYVLNCQFVNASKLQHIQFLGNCVTELYGVDLSTAYQHGFVFIKQLGMILREALNMKTKEAFRKVYEWKYMNCLELWTGAICAFGSEADFRPLAYPLTQIISGVARLVPTAKYFPLRLRCARMLNRIAAATDTFIPVSLLLLDMLDMKEMNRPPTGGVGKAVDLRTILKVSKPTLKTRAFQEACVFSVVEEVAEHLVQWSYSIAFFELSFIPLVRLRCFHKSTKVERFRREVKQLIHQIEVNAEFTNAKRATVTFVPSGTAPTSFLEDEKKSGNSPISQYVVALHQRAQQRNDSMVESSVVIGARSSMFGSKVSDTDKEDDSRNMDMEEGATVFSSSWLPGKDPRTKKTNEQKSEKKQKKRQDKVAHDEDIVEDFVPSSDEDGSVSDGSMSDTSSLDTDDEEKTAPPKHVGNKRKFSKELASKGRFHSKKSKRKKTLH
ncbi:Nucleolar complex protein 2-like protein [Thalictrum thalictroides]|uniref:Nucleolar complex protein 2-like protein n=1 Tax=Thalictrum thalictroides TaxID=46969 RepID=A0A7J6W816_THATH|nr:Nucleolar complex protein 2-like protein [Thalictrum thalictroides]